ncbi:MAG: membrane protein [Clostridiaceae bacterium]|nr:membrane protein [Clostridiaceae bacterium]
MIKEIKEQRIQVMKQMPSLFFGFFLYAIGILSSLYADLGMSPWGVFHMGVANLTPFTLGQITQLVGVVILCVAYAMGEVPGIGSIFNMIFIGLFIDLIDASGIFFTPELLIGRIIMLSVGIVASGWASYFYLRVHFGAGPRDGLMEGLVKKLQKPVWLIRGVMECTVVIIGYFLGGPLGIGTIITALTIGFSVEFAFKVGKYNPKEIKHINCFQMFGILTGKKLLKQTNH